MSKIIPELIHIVGLTVYKANLNTTDSYLNAPFQPESIGVKYAQTSSLGIEDNAIRIRLDILLDGQDKSSESIGLFAEYGLEFHFVVENLVDFLEEHEDEKNISGTLGGVLMGIAFSTARGIVLERTQGTFFNGVILPIIDPKTLF